jgi:hypothetical protein
MTWPDMVILLGERKALGRFEVRFEVSGLSSVVSSIGSASHWPFSTHPSRKYVIGRPMNERIGSSGVHLCRVTAGHFVSVQKMLLRK